MEPVKVFKGKPTVTSIISGGRRKLHYRYEDKSEMVEEYDIKSFELLTRRWKRPSDIREADWIYEIGEPPKKSEEAISISSNNPVFVRKDTADAYQFRIRNLPYPAEVYSVEVDSEKQELVVRTSNKKYYKRFDIPEMKRKGSKLEADEVSWVYTNNTLVVSYPKPVDLLKQQEELNREFAKLNLKNPKEGDLECNQQ